jgi:hypothetical protein
LTTTYKKENKLQILENSFFANCVTAIIQNIFKGQMEDGLRQRIPLYYLTATFFSAQKFLKQN